MKSNYSLNPFDVPATFRSYLYDQIVLRYETKKIFINQGDFNKKCIEGIGGIEVINVRKLSDMERFVNSYRGAGESLIFYTEGRGYECLFKRFRDSFAHGHYGSDKRGWITVWHRYKGGKDGMEVTRLFARLRQTTLKELVDFLDLSKSPNK